jgi:hypothetical protein
MIREAIIRTHDIEGTHRVKTRNCAIRLIAALSCLLVLVGCHPLARETTPAGVPPLMITDFDNCRRINNLGGEMGAAYNPPDNLTDTYITESARGCVARLAYKITGWAAFWLKLGDGADLSPYTWLTFDVRADPQPGLPAEIKIELKRANGAEIMVSRVTGIGAEWKTLRVKLADFRPTGSNPSMTTLVDVQELVFTFEAAGTGPQGVVYVDSIRVERQEVAP